MTVAGCESGAKAPPGGQAPFSERIAPAVAIAAPPGPPTICFRELLPDAVARAIRWSAAAIPPAAGASWRSQGRAAVSWENTQTPNLHVHHQIYKQRLLAIFCLWCADVEEAGTSSSTMTWRPVRAARCALTASRAPRSVWPFVASTVTTIGAACALAGGTARGAGDPNARVSVQTSARRSLRIPPPHCQRARALRMF